MKRKLLLRILLPVCILAVIAGIWIIKNTTSEGGSTSPFANEDFALTAESIDLPALQAYGLPIILDFGSDSCLPCQQMAHVLVTMNSEMQGKAIIKFIDAWEHSEALTGYPVQVIPTQIFINADGSPYVPGEDISVEFIFYANKEGEHIYTVHQGGLTEAQMRTILADMGVEE